MKRLFLIFLLFGSIKFAIAQEFVIRKADSAGYFSFLKVKEGNVLRFTGSYDVLKGSQFRFMTNWGISSDQILYWTNGENIYKFNLSSNKESILIFSQLNWILEFSVRADYIYVIYNPSKKEGLHDNRYTDKIHFCRINKNTLVKEELQFPNRYNATNLSISNDEKWATFINVRTEKKSMQELILYNIKKATIKIIDNANVKKSEWLGNDDIMNSAFWKDSVHLIFYKHAKENDFGQLLNYNIKNGSKQVWLAHFPERDFTWFGLDNNFFYCSGRHDLYRINHKSKEIIFKDANHDNILNAVILSK